jgi:integrase
VESLGLSRESRDARSNVWRRFLRLLDENGTPFEKAAPADLRHCAFDHRHGQRPKEHAERVLVLAEKAVGLLQETGALPAGKNSAFEARLGMGTRPKNDPTVFPAPSALPGLQAFLLKEDNEGEDRMRRRDKALFALVLGAGAPPSAVGLTDVSCIRTAIRTDRILLRSEGPSVKRPLEWEAILLPCAVPALERWLQVCGASSSAPAFPGHGGKGLSRAQAFRIVRDLLVELGTLAQVERVCPQTLRNGYFGLLADSGLSRRAVAASMGWSDSDGEQFRRMIRGWENAKRLAEV